MGRSHPWDGRSAASGGRIKVSRLLPSGLSHNLLGSTHRGNRPASNPRWSAIPKPEPFGDLGQLGVESKSALRIGFNVAIVEMSTIDLAPRRNCQTNGFQRQERIFSLGIRAARHVGPAVGDRLPRAAIACGILQRPGSRSPGPAPGT